MSIPSAVAPIVLLTQSGDGLTLPEIVDSLPSDPASLVVLALVLGFGGAIAYFGARSGKPVPKQDPQEDEAPSHRRSSG